MYMNSSSEREKMNMTNMRLAFSGDGGAATVYKPVMPTESYPQQSQPPTSTPGGGDVSFLQHQQQQQQQQHHGSSTGLSSGSGEPEKRKRGRPRKYGPQHPSDANANANTCMALNLTSSPLTAPSNSNPTSNSNSNSNATKKPRGRPPGSFRKQHSAALGSAGVGFTPHVITVEAGEDVLAKVMSFSQNGPRAVCILSANGAISNVTLRQAMTSGGTVTYEGRFEILSLSGSILLSESGGQRSRTGGLSVSLAGPDGRVLGGGVAGLLTAASPVQVIVGSFLADGWKESKAGIQSEPLSSTPNHVARASAVGSPLSRGNFSESSGGPGSPLNQSTGGCSNSNPAGMPNITWK